MVHDVGHASSLRVSVLDSGSLSLWFRDASMVGLDRSAHAPLLTRPMDSSTIDVDDWPLHTGCAPLS
jgi:hypothetical protein